MTSLQTLFIFFVVMVVTKTTFGDKDAEKCSKIEGSTESLATTSRKRLLCSYDKLTAPVNVSLDNRVYVEVYLAAYRINFKSSPGLGNIDVYTIIENSPNWFTMSAYIIMSWKDHRLQWNQSEYGGIDQIHFERSEIWVPDIEANRGNEVIFATYEGELILISWMENIGNCRPIYFSWGDQRECVLSFRVEPEDKVQLSRREHEDTDYHLSNSASWSVVKTKRIYPLKKGEPNAEFVKRNKQMPWKYGPGYFETQVTIQRNFAIQDAVVFAPAAVLLILLVSSTWIPAKQEARVALLSTIFIVQVFMFHQACRAMPFLPDRIVNIVALYHNIILCSGAAIVEWLIAFIIANKMELPTRTTSENVLPGPTVFSFTTLKTIFVVSGKDSRPINRSQLLDRICFLLLVIVSFVLVVIQGRRPPSPPLQGVHLV